MIWSSVKTAYDYLLETIKDQTYRSMELSCKYRDYESITMEVNPDMQTRESSCQAVGSVVVVGIATYYIIPLRGLAGTKPVTRTGLCMY